MKSKAFFVTALLSLSAGAARAEVDLARALPELEGAGLPRLFAGRVSVLVERDVPGAVPVGPRLFAVERSAAELGELVRSDPELVLSWAPPRRFLLDRADGWVGASAFRNQTGLTGRGVVVGIILGIVLALVVAGRMARTPAEGPATDLDAPV